MGHPRPEEAHSRVELRGQQLGLILKKAQGWPRKGFPAEESGGGEALRAGDGKVHKAAAGLRARLCPRAQKPVSGLDSSQL